jgi:hypothetical protein
MKLFFLYIILGSLMANDAELGLGLQLSSKWFQGPNLVYDCVYRHYVCTGERGLGRCKVDQSIKLLGSEEDKVKCVVVKKYSSLKKCVEKQYELIGQVKPMPFCLKRLQNSP